MEGEQERDAVDCSGTSNAFLTFTGPLGRRLCAPGECVVNGGGTMGSAPWAAHSGISRLRSASSPFATKKLSTSACSSWLRESKDSAMITVRSFCESSRPLMTSKDVRINSLRKHLFHMTTTGIVCSSSVASLDPPNLSTRPFTFDSEIARLNIVSTMV